jgi:arsenate reductase
MSEAIRVLIIGDENAARSQMAEGILITYGGAAFEVYSAGLRPRPIRPEAVEAMHEIGIDISRHRSKAVDEFAGQSFEFIVLVCEYAKENCPYFAGWAERVDLSVDDPSAEADELERMAAFERVRNEIRERLAHFFGPYAGGRTKTG